MSQAVTSSETSIRLHADISYDPQNKFDIFTGVTHSRDYDDEFFDSEIFKTSARDIHFDEVVRIVTNQIWNLVPVEILSYYVDGNRIKDAATAIVELWWALSFKGKRPCRYELTIDMNGE
jgi:hypothetical protein